MILEKKDGGRGGKGERAGSIDRFPIVTLNDQIHAGWTDPYDQTRQFLVSFLPSSILNFFRGARVSSIRSLNLSHPLRVISLVRKGKIGISGSCTWLPFLSPSPRGKTRDRESRDNKNEKLSKDIKIYIHVWRESVSCFAVFLYI